jgi:hypothetical protein
MSQDELSASGPYPTQRAAEDYIRRETKSLWEESCTCLQREGESPWCKPLHIVKVVRTVRPAIRGRVTLEDA